MFSPCACFAKHAHLDHVPFYFDGVYQLLKRRRHVRAKFTLKRLTRRQASLRCTLQQSVRCVALYAETWLF